MRLVGRTIGREMRALYNLQTAGVGLTSWSPTINLIRDPREPLPDRTQDAAAPLVRPPTLCFSEC